MLKEAVNYTLPEEDTVRLVQITDPHLFASQSGQLLGVNTAHSLSAVLNTLAATEYPAHLMLATGDISQDCTPDSYRHFIDAIEFLNLPCHYLPGNHDDPHFMNLHMQGAQVYGQQRILIGNWQILMLDSTVRGRPGGHMAEEQFGLIDAAIEAHPERHTLLVMHHNPILMDCAWLDQHCLDNGADLLARVAKYPQVKGVLWGHVHQAVDELYPREGEPMLLMATPSTCIQFMPKSPYFALDPQQPGYRLLELASDGSIQTHVHRVPGELFSPDPGSSGY